MYFSHEENAGHLHQSQMSELWDTWSPQTQDSFTNQYKTEFFMDRQNYACIQNQTIQELDFHNRDSMEDSGLKIKMLQENYALII